MSGLNTDTSNGTWSPRSGSGRVERRFSGSLSPVSGQEDSAQHPDALVFSEDVARRLPSLAGLLTGQKTAKRRTRRTIHADPIDENGRIRSEDDVRKEKRRIANRDSAQHAKVRNRRELAEARTEVGELIADNVALEDRVTELLDMHKQSCKEAAHYKHWFNMAMRSNNNLADRLGAYDASMQRGLTPSRSYLPGNTLPSCDTINRAWRSPSPNPFCGLASFAPLPMQNGPAMFPPLTCTSSGLPLNMLDLAGDLCQPAYSSVVGHELFPELRLPA